jgi:hypothetical protein
MAMLASGWPGAVAQATDGQRTWDAAGCDETRFSLMFYDGAAWTVAPKLFRDPANNHGSSVTGLGVYALVQQ